MSGAVRLVVLVVGLLIVLFGIGVFVVLVREAVKDRRQRVAWRRRWAERAASMDSGREEKKQ